EADFRGIRSIFEIDDKITAPSFGFRGAEHYYATQSSNQFLERIRVPTMVVQAQDDTFVPFEIFRHPAFESNPHLTLVAVETGGQAPGRGDNAFPFADHRLCETRPAGSGAKCLPNLADRG